MPIPGIRRGVPMAPETGEFFEGWVCFVGRDSCLGWAGNIGRRLLKQRGLREEIQQGSRL